MRKLGYFLLLGTFSINGFASTDIHKPSAEKSVLHSAASSHSAPSGGGHKPHWGYAGSEGPESWGNLSESYALCKDGQNQSPIDIDMAANRGLDEISFHYSASPVKAINNGHTIQMNYAPGSYIEIGARQYQLLQFHFHTPSEHKIKGKNAPMEVHFVHKSDDGHLAVVGVMLEEGLGNKSLGWLWRVMPETINNEVYAEGKMLNAADLLPKNRAYYHYRGSLTTPPCSEGVNWFVMQEPISISAKAINKFYSVVGENARPVQPLHARIPMRLD